MGNTSSISQEEADPWWSTSQSQQHNEQNVLQQTRRPEAEMAQDSSSWLQRELSLGRTIQHLAEDNMKLTIARQEAERKLEELQRSQEEQEKQQQICEALRTQIQSGREERQMITAEMERLREVFDEEREAKEQSMAEVDKLRRERDDSRRDVKKLLEQLEAERRAADEAAKEAKEQSQSEFERLKRELKTVKMLLVSTKDAQQSTAVAGKEETPTEASECTDSSSENQLSEDRTVAIRNPETRAEMERFKAELNIRRESRQRAMQAVSSEMERLRSELNTEREMRQQAENRLEEYRDKSDQDVSEQLGEVRQELKNERKRSRLISTENERLQADIENGRLLLAEKTDEFERIQTQIESERQHSQQQVQALKEVSAICKQMLMIREGQVLQLKNKLDEIENTSASDRVSADLRAEYRTQIENIRSLRSLYEERMNIITEEKEKLKREAADEVNKRLEAEKRVEEMQSALTKREEQLEELNIRLDDSHDESLRLRKELALINNIFTQMLMGGHDTDLDKLTRLLEENHDLITEITNKESSSEVASTLPKLLLDLITQAENGTANDAAEATDGEGVKEEEKEECTNGLAVQEIASNLPKVWKVLMELLSHHATPAENATTDENESCYKQVDTPSGPRLVLSVSKTFLHLKDLILEKKSLQKELGKLKHLNGHLESKLREQERRLSMVSTELHKTWDVVGQMQTQHQKLHTHEKILRYELQQKRKLLTELKQELEYCREKWERARQKNSESEIEWKKLRMEFASRKVKQPSDSLNNSGESGCFSDDTKEEATTEEAPPLINDEISSCPEMLGSSPPSETLLIEEELEPPAEDVSSFDPLQHEDIQENSPSPELPNVDNCSTISMINLLKEQLAFFTRNLEYITSDTSYDISSNDLEALESIFALPPIQIPESLTIPRKGFLKNGYSNSISDFFSDIGAFDSVRATSSKCPSPISTNPQSFSEIVAEASFPEPSETIPASSSTVCKSSSEYRTDRVYPPGAEDQNVADIRPSPEERLTSEEHSTAPCPSTVTEVIHPASSSTETVTAEGNCSSQKELRASSTRTPEEIAEARAERLKRLEEQCQLLYKKVTKTTHRSAALCNRLEELHEHYGSPPPSASGQENRGIPVPPPLPQGRLRGRRLPLAAHFPHTPETTLPLNSEDSSSRIPQHTEDIDLERSQSPSSSSLPEHTEDIHLERSQTPSSSSLPERNIVSAVPASPPLPPGGITGLWIPTETSATRLSSSNSTSSSSQRRTLNETITRQNTDCNPHDNRE